MKNVVFIRGWASTDHSFKKFLQAKPVTTEVIMIAADNLLHDFNLVRAVERLDDIIKLQTKQDVILVGHSLGGAVAIAYVAKYPKYISKLFLINTIGYPINGDMTKDSVKMFFRNSKKFFSQISVKSMEAINLLKRPHFHIMLGRFAKKINLSGIAKNITIPVTIMYGNNDKLVSIKISQKLKHDIPNSKLIIMDGMDHDWIQTNPEVFWQYLK